MQAQDKTPIVSTGQGDFTNDYTGDDLTSEQGGSVGLMLVVLAYFVAGIVVGAWLF